MQGRSAQEARPLLPAELYLKRKSTTRFVRPTNLETVKRQLKNYQLLRAFVDRWIDLATELATLRIENQEE